MSLRLILIIIGVLIVAAILIDGYRHWRRAQKHQNELDKRNVRNQAPKEPRFEQKIDHRVDDIDFIPKIKLDDTESDDALFRPKAARPAPSVKSAPIAPAAPPAGSTQEDALLAPKPAARVAAHAASSNASISIPAPLPKKEKFIILHVLAEPDTYFSGEALAAKFAAQGLVFGPMDIYHHYEYANGSGDILFSVANAFEPGTLKLDPKGFYTQGLTLFIQLPGECDTEQAFESMLNTATLLAKSFNARLCDHQRQALTPARVEEYRNEVIACNVI